MDELLPAELDQLFMDWLQDIVQPYDSVFVREVPVCHSHEEHEWCLSQKDTHAKRNWHDSCPKKDRRQH